MDYFPSSLLDNGVMSIQEMISLDCEVKTDDALESLMNSACPEKINHSDFDKIFLPDNDFANSLDCLPLDDLSSQDLDTMKWFNDNSSDVCDIVTNNHLDVENTNPNLMVNPETVMPQPIHIQLTHTSGIATPPLTPNTPNKLSAKMDFSTPSSSSFNISNVHLSKMNNTSSPHRANTSTPLRCQRTNQFNTASPNNHVSKPPSPAVRALYREINNPSRNNPILLEQLQNPVQSAIKAAQNIAALNNQFASTSTTPHSIRNDTTPNYKWNCPMKNNNQRNVNQSKVYQKPVFSYSCLIAMALKNSKNGSLPVSEIYNFMITHFPYFKTAPGGWKNSVRHNLSLNKCFEKVENPNISSNAKKGCLWGLNPAKIAKMAEEITKWRKKDPESVHNSMSDPDKIDLIEQGKAGSPPPLTDTPNTKGTMIGTPPLANAPTSPMHKPSTPLMMPRSCKEEVMDIGYNDMVTLENGLKIDPVLSELSAQWDEDLTSDLNLVTSLPSSPLCHSPITSNRTFNCITSSSYLNVHSSPLYHYYGLDTTPTKQFHPQTPSRTVSAL